MAEVRISSRVGWRGLPPARRLRTAALATLAELDREAGLSLTLVDPEFMRELNRRYRHLDQVCDVLSFPSAPELAGQWLGDVLLCPEQVALRAAARGRTTGEHCLHLTVHGVLHLSGHDHDQPDRAERMESLERRILARLGVRDPYA